ncbi:O-antigen ligase family protein [Paucibacter sp. DJ2R-2]|uniref:O-antigen ligase family protein n=1 Tax=Paucibacter sp. DJ2R-2 TaxID=2893558 RepID=UPI0021E3BAB9|nr:O-antigen ligase family protein [Paucibacter sp. DJ2R-2]MCV2419190.1 Wzy polymerase domain-containing protein [Paucibacter sp. DJ4R-1]MCV2437855.1 Wzy polymerase domain-containing protein [Paucibacter sp. DJ2R-2]
MIRQPERWAAQLQTALPAMLLALSWLIPKHEAPWLAFHSDLCAAAALVMAVLVWLRQSEDRMLRMPSLALAALLLAAVPALQFAFGLIHFGGDALMASLYLVGFAWAVLVGAHGGPDAALRLSRIAPWLLGAALISAFIASLQWLRIDTGMEWLLRTRPMARPYGNLAQTNLLASLLVLGQLAALGLHQCGKLGLRSLIALSLVLWAGIAMSGSRTGRLELLVLLAWLLLIQSRADLRLSRCAMLGFGALGLLLFSAWPLLESALGLGRVQVTVHMGSHSMLEAGTRAIHWRTLVDALQESPLWGFGWNQVAVAQTSAALNHPASYEFIEHSHNLLLDLLVWNGLPLGGLLILGLLGWLSFQLRACRTPRAACLLAGLLMLLTHAMTEYPLEYFIFLLPLGLMMGELEAMQATGQTWRVPRPLILTAGLLSVALLTAIALEYPRHERNHRRMQSDYEAGQMQAAPPPPDARFTLLTQLQPLPELLLISDTSSYSDAQIRQLAQLAERFAYAPVLEQRARLLQQQGQVEAARHTVDLLCKLHQKKDCARVHERFGMGTNPKKMSQEPGR